MRKVLLLGLLGAAGCAAGAAGGAAASWLLTPRPSGDAPPAPTLFSKDLQDQLDERGAKTGDVRVSLRWYNTNDLDLHCIDPRGEEIYFLHRKAASGGELDVDSNAHDPLYDRPVENIYWPAGQAPEGSYQVSVEYYRGHGAPDPTRFLCGWIAGGEKHEIQGALSDGDGRFKVGEFHYRPAKPGPPPPRFTWASALDITLRTGLMGAGLALALACGQEWYLRRRVVSVRAALAAAGGLLAGAAAGGVGQVLFTLAPAGDAWEFIGRAFGWLVLGGLLGGGMALAVPNLKRGRAAAAGAAGGLVGAVAFEAAVRVAGAGPAVVVGAAALGLAVGLTVALVETLFREAWLEVHYGPREMRTVSIGGRPITVGGDLDCTVYVRGAPSIALRYLLLDGRILCGVGPTAEPGPAPPGDQRTVGTAHVVVRAQTPRGGRGESAARVAGPAAITLLLPGKPPIPLSAGRRLSPADLPGLEPGQKDGVVAEVAAHPSNVAVLGLKNLSRRTWSVTLPGGAARQVQPGRSLQLQPGVAVNFGPVQGSLQ